MGNDLTVLLEQERKELRAGNVLVLSGDVDQPMAKEFIEDVSIILRKCEHSLKLGKDVTINIIISSQGGGVFSGISIIRAIRVAQRAGVKVIGSVYGHACSMAFFILECCDERVMGKLDSLMAHGVTTGFQGDMKSMAAENKLLTHWHQAFAKLLAERCMEKDEGVWLELLMDNTPQWYTAEESKEKGLVDRIE